MKNLYDKENLKSQILLGFLYDEYFTNSFHLRIPKQHIFEIDQVQFLAGTCKCRVKPTPIFVVHHLVTHPSRIDENGIPLVRLVPYGKSRRKRI